MLSLSAWRRLFWPINGRFPGLGKIGLGAAFCYCAQRPCAWRGLTFSPGKLTDDFFIGIPSPAAAVTLVTFIAAADLAEVDIPPSPYIPLRRAFLLLLAFTMVSGVRYYSFKDLNIKRRIPLRYTAVVVLSGMGIYALAENVMLLLLLMLSGYFLSGYGYELWKWYSRRRRSGDSA